jgi:hypothetical protein
MSDELGRSGEERIDEEGRNPTQRRIDEEGAAEEPVDAQWGTEDTSHEGEEGQDVV